MKYLNLFDAFKNSMFPPSLRKNFESNLKILDKEETINYIIENCTEFIDNPKLIYRYIQNDNKYFYSKPIERYSRDNPNWYSILISNFDSWKDYPKRTNSFCCYIDSNIIDFPSYNYLVIPEDNSKWGMCDTDDIYDSFYNYLGLIYDFFEDLNILSTKLNLGGISDDSYIEMKNDIIKLDETLHQKFNNFLEFESMNLINNQKLLTFLYKFWDKELLKSLEIVMKPELNNFKLYEYKNIKYPNIKKECWTDSSCVFIKLDEIDDIFYGINKKINKKIKF